MTAWVADIYPTLIVAGLSHTLLLKPQRPSSDDARYPVSQSQTYTNLNPRTSDIV
jgi:hypothetical protein